MIRTVLHGRFGNHLFQVAAALALARKHGTGIIIDGSELPDVSGDLSFRRLPVLKLPFARKPASILIDRINQKLLGRHSYQLNGRHLHSEKNHAFDPLVSCLGPNAILSGYFQNERYFASIGDELPDWFDLSPWLARANSSLRDAVCGNVETIGIHVRRTDYLQLPAQQVCGPAYYNRAIARVHEATPGAQVVVISDDIDWCRHHFGNYSPVIPDHRTHPYGMLTDMALLSACTHQVIANSSFSWWAAWLNRNPSRRVMMPDMWTKDGSVPIDTKFMRGAEIIPTHD